MKSDVIVVSSRGSRMDAALQQAEKVAEYKELPRKDALNLRLLAEEMMGMMGSIAGEVEGRFWIEDSEGVFQLHLKVTTNMNARKRSQLISASSTGQNEANRGIMGKIRSFFDPVDDLPVFFDAAMATSPDDVYTDMGWSMRAYQSQVQEYLKQQCEGAEEAWDELEKSVVTHVADDVRVSIRGREVEMVILKRME